MENMLKMNNITNIALFIFFLFSCEKEKETKYSNNEKFSSLEIKREENQTLYLLKDTLVNGYWSFTNNNILRAMKLNFFTSNTYIDLRFHKKTLTYLGNGSIIYTFYNSGMIKSILKHDSIASKEELYMYYSNGNIHSKGARIGGKEINRIYYDKKGQRIQEALEID
jgi:hypothetical protein